MEKRDHCPACLSGDIFLVQKIKDHFLTGEAFEMSECRVCTLRFTNPHPDEHEILRYYESEEYISHSDSSSGAIAHIYQIVRRFTLKNKRRMIERIHGGSSRHILDIGAGTGAFLDVMKNSGWTVHGIEPSEKARAEALQSYSLKLEDVDELFHLEHAKFDVITLWHVLEHVHRLDDYVQQMKDLLRPAGILIIAMPNYRSYDSGYYKDSWAAYDMPRHLYHFNHSAMTALMSRFGMRISSLFRMPFDPFYVSMLSEKYLFKAGKSGSMIRAFMIGLVSHMMSLGNKKKSSSLIYVVVSS